MDFIEEQPEQTVVDMVSEYILLDKNLIPEASDSLKVMKNRRTELRKAIKDAFASRGYESLGRDGYNVSIKKQEEFAYDRSKYQECKQFVVENDLAFLIKEGFDNRSFSKTMREFFGDNDDIPEFITKTEIFNVSCTKA